MIAPTANLHAAAHYAGKANRDYITPEDIRDAINAGADPCKLAHEVLVALGRKECEDVSLCAFVASEAFKDK